jgi:UDP-2,3-diacylglucosamine pyrophosphatase LpxH
MMDYTTLIISDLHLGAYNCRADLLSNFLLSKFDRLIINGDIIDHSNLHSFKPEHWLVIDKLRSLASEKRLVVINGNHDMLTTSATASFLPYMLGINCYSLFELIVNHKNYLITHGHAFDSALNWPRTVDALDFIYRTTQHINKDAARWLKHKAKTFGGIVDKVKTGAISKAKSGGYEGVIAGHTHHADDDYIDGIHYLNTGSWVETPCHYVIVNNRSIGLAVWPDS